MPDGTSGAMSELIWLVRPPEPLSGAAREILQAPDDRLEDLGGFIRTSRARRIGYELARYCLREQEGCSLLIAGGRGAGKTTLIRLVVQELIINWRRGKILESARSSSRKTRPLIPLPIILHGPTLLDIYGRSDWAFTPGSEVAPALREKFEDSRRRAALKERALRTTITALYTHLRDALIDAWDNAVRTRHGGMTQDLAELRAHLDLLLDTAPEVAPLRRIWKRAGFLEGGVLPELYPSLTGYPARPDQGVRELHALAACAQSFLSILGQIKETQTQGRKDTDEASIAIGVATTPHEAEKKPASQPAAEGRSLTILIPTLAASVGVIAHTVATPVEGLSASHLAGSVGVGIVAMLVAHASIYFSKLTLRAERSRRRSSYHDRALTVDVDWSAQRLERELPKLLLLVKQAGLAPIFVIDELDKIEEPFDELHDFLHLTKHIVRDQAAFLFLSNRDYFERIMETGADLTIGAGEASEMAAGPAASPDDPAPAPRDASEPGGTRPSRSARYRLALDAVERRNAENARRVDERRQKATARTFYEHMLSLFYEPADFRHYFETLFRKAMSRRNTEAIERSQPVTPPNGDAIIDVLALGTILAFRSRLSPFDFNKRLNALLDDEGRLRKIDFGKGLPFFDGMMRQHLLLQVIAETVARSAHVAARIDNRPRDAQMLYDALYYLAERIEFSPPAPAAFVVTITQRDLGAYLLRKASSDRDPELLKGSLEPETLDWLFNQVLEQVTYLASPQDIVRNLSEPESALLPDDVVRPDLKSDAHRDLAVWYADRERLRLLLRQALSRAEPLIGSVTADENEIRFDLLVDGFANPRKTRATEPEEIEPRDLLAAQVADLGAWQGALETLLGNPAEAHVVAARLNVLPEGIRWEPVQDALDQASMLLDDAPETGSSPAATSAILRDLTRDLGAYLQAIEGYRDLFDQCMRAASVIALALEGATLTARRGAALLFMDRTLPPQRDPAALEAAMRMPPNERREWTATAIGRLLQRPRNLERLPMAVWCDFLRGLAVETQTAATKLDPSFWQAVDLRYWSQWSWKDRGLRVNRRRETNLVDLLFAARHGSFRFLEPGGLNARLGLWSLLLFHALRVERGIPDAVPARMRRDLGLDRDAAEPALLVISQANDTLAWAVSGKVPALALHFEQEAGTSLLRAMPALDLVARALALPQTGDEDRKSPDQVSRRRWMLAADTAEPMPPDVRQLFDALGEPVSYVCFGPARMKWPEDRPFLPDPKSLETLYQFALDNRREESS